MKPPLVVVSTLLTLGLSSFFALSAYGQQCAGDEKGKVLAYVTNGRLGWVDCTSQLKERVEVPSAVRVFPFRQSILVGSYGGYFSKSAGKIDIVWIDDTITVSEPLRSFGGDIILFAETVNINAPIDSRVYIDHAVEHFSATVGTRDHPAWRSPSTGIVGIANKTDEWVKDDANYLSAFRDYYAKCFDCYQGETRRPELPSGLGAVTPIPATGVIDEVAGDAAPDSFLSFPQARSGNIYIFANKINVDPKLVDPLVPPERAECDGGNTAYRPFAINAGGLLGGRGGTGSASNCPTGTGCVAEMYSRGGVSGPGGQGGDAGDIRVTLIDRTDADVDKIDKSLRGVATIRGGAPGSNLKLRTPSPRGNYPITSSRCSFKSLGVWPSAASGKDGVLTTKSETATIALMNLARLLSANDIRLDYDLFTYLNVAKQDRNIYSLSPIFPLTEYLSKSLVNAELRYLRDIDRLFTLNQPESEQYLPLTLRNLSVDKLDQSFLPTQQSALLRELTSFGQTDGAMAYFRNTGGMFNISSKNAYQRMLSGQLKSTVSFGNTALTEIKDELRSMNQAQFDYMSRSQGDKLLVLIKKVQDDIKAAEEEARKDAAKNAGLEPVVTAITALGEAVSKFATAAAADDYVSAAATLPAVVKAFVNLVSLQNQGSVRDIQTLREQLVFSAGFVGHGIECIHAAAPSARSCWRAWTGVR